MRVVSWNIQWGKGTDGRVDLRRIADHLYSMDADVICLQEVAVNHAGLVGNSETDPFSNQENDQVSLLSGLFPGFAAVYAAGSDLPDGLGGRRTFGNLVLSRADLGEVVRHALPFPFDPSVPGMQRVALEVTVQAPWGPVQLVTTHLEYYSALQRRAQLRALRAIAGQSLDHARQPRKQEADAPFAVLPKGRDCIVCGDFNCAPTSPELLEFLDEQPDPGTLHEIGAVPPTPTFYTAWSALHPDLAPQPTIGCVASASFPAPMCFDHVMVTAGLLPRLDGFAVDLQCRASDHQPVVVDFCESIG